MFNIVWGFCFDYSHGTAYSTKCFGECEQFGDCGKKVWHGLLMKIWTSSNVSLVMQMKPLKIPKPPLNTHAIQTLLVYGVAHNWMSSKTSHHSLNHWPLHVQWAMKFEKNGNNWKSWKEIWEGGQMWVGCNGTIPYAICRPKEMIVGKTYQTQASTTFGHFWVGSSDWPRMFQKIGQ